MIDRMNSSKSTSNEVFTQKEKRLIQLLRGINYGELKVIVQDRQPVRIEEITKSIKL